jgi:hypothetical protein
VIVGALGEADEVQGTERLLAAPGQADPGIKEPVGHVVQHALVLGQEELLEHEADPGSSQRRQLAVGHRGHVQSGDPHGAGTGAAKGTHQV